MVPRVSVVMSNYNGVTLKLVEESLIKILKNPYSNLEVILVDNASTDTSVEIIQKRFGKNSRFRLLQNPINMYSQGLNLGLKNSTGKYVAFFNNDASVANDYFDKLIGFLEKHPKVALIQGKLLSYKNHKIIDCIGETMDIFGNPRSLGQGEKAEGSFEEVMNILSVSGSCSILRKSVTSDIGYFDNEYGIGYEDMDLSLRARLFGYDIVYFPNALVYHKRGATDLSPMIRVTVKWHYNKNRLMTLFKNYPLPFLFISLPVVLVQYSVLGIIEILRKDKFQMGISRFTSMLWIVYNLDSLFKERSIVQEKIKHVPFSSLLPLFCPFSLKSILFYLTKQK